MFSFGQQVIVYTMNNINIANASPPDLHLFIAIACVHAIYVATYTSIL